MKILITAFLLICMTLPAAAAKQQILPMRGLIWGVPKETVKEYDNSTFVGEEADTLVYRSKMYPDLNQPPFNAFVEYHFTNNALDRIQYGIPIDKTDPESAFDDALLWQIWLDSVYNQQSKPKFDFRYRNVREDREKWGWSIYRGDGTLTVDWASAESKATLSLSGNKEYEPRLLLTLTPPSP